MPTVQQGAFAIYIEPWHSDIMDWLDLRKNHGKEEARARDLFYGLWINDLFMRVNTLSNPMCTFGLPAPMLCAERLCMQRLIVRRRHPPHLIKVHHDLLIGVVEVTVLAPQQSSR